jgi:hypothetical protein
VDAQSVRQSPRRPDNFALEIKLAGRVGRGDARHLRKLGPLLDKPLLLGLVVSNDREAGCLCQDPPLYKVPASRLLA